jgi:hypothetical protein
MTKGDARPSARERVTAIASEILTAFESGELPHALAQLFIRRKIEVPSRHWTWTNRLIALRRSHVYAAGFRQWQEIGRSVRKGEHAFHILAPRVLVAKEDDENEGVKKGDRLMVGFLPVAVFGYFQTEGDPLPGAEDAPEFVEGLPLVHVARSWGLSVALHSYEDSPGRLGYFAEGLGISLGVRNLATWAHELIHAADSRLGTLERGKLAAEVVAEFGGAILLECLGHPAESDRGGAYAYIKRHCDEEKRNPLGACTELLDRTCDCVAFLLEEAEKVSVLVPSLSTPPAASSHYPPIPSLDARSGAMPQVAAL